MKIQQFINERHKYKVDKTYQRPEGVWSRADKQCLIDTILRAEPIPIFFLNHISREDFYYIVDGQQRLHAIQQFHDNKFTLDEKFSLSKDHGKNFNGNNPISDEQREQFLEYKLNFKMLKDYDDERIRMIFSRLQRGKPLQLGERLNAKPGNIVLRMREIAEHPFMRESIGVPKKRYGNYPDAARILFYEKFGAKHMGAEEINNFFDTYRDMDRNDKDYKSVVRVLNYLARCFPSEPGDYAYLSKHAWVLAAYGMARNLLLRYSTANIENKIQGFVRSFHSKVYSEDWRGSNPEIQKFYENVRGGWSEKIISLRADILLKHCLEKIKPNALSDTRQITDEEKARIYGERGECCERCSTQFNDHREPEYHHIKRYVDGGESHIDNIEMLCRECHKKVHGKSDITETVSMQDEPDDVE